MTGGCMIIHKIMLFLLPLTGFSGIAQEKAGDQRILSGVVTISARLQSKLPFGAGEVFVYEVVLDHKGEVFRYACTVQGNDVQDAITTLRKGAGWVGGFLFARSRFDVECGTGWRCPIEQVFEINNGKLVRVGEILAGRDGKPGANFKNGFFHDIYNRLEDSGFDGHAGAPGVRLVLTVTDGHFEVSMAETWAANRPDFNQNIRDIQIVLGSKQRDQRLLAAALLRNAVVAKYCKKQVELENARNIARSNLDSSRFAEFERLLGQVIPGELPNRY